MQKSEFLKNIGKSLCRLCFAKINLKNKSNFIVIKNCPSIVQNLLKNKKKSLKAKINLTIYKCYSCDLVQLLNEPLYYYKSSIRSSHITPFRQKEIFKQLKNVRKDYDKNSTILEVGCGRGEYLNLLSKFFNNVFGFEYNKKLINSKITKLKIKKFYPQIIDKNKSPTNVDGIFCFNFLEHAVSPVLFLQSVLSHLKPNGFIVIEVPNFEHMFKKKIFYDFTIEHLSYFTKKTLTQLVNLCGLKIKKISSFRESHTISFYCQKLVNKSNFSNKINFELFSLVSKINQSITKNEKNVIWGACHQSFDLILKTKLLENLSYVVDSSDQKQNRFCPGTKIPIYSPSKLLLNIPDHLIICASSYSNEVYEIIKRKYNFIKKISIVSNNKIVNLKNE
jgi:2-polyprenyl-3-methyl-5-hydroxy-6-metoxy-1,4-benzoquinol methylase